eukprot:TRINITY_DN9030_c0_g1_i1.p1 TRINITY_DN9030_c0_g1~~TRINITY_DN9030_c0_g1_i1.p1  ORF type:complete len:250 (+),score=31.61 TRINITY_DN9030_c0_g1_i1:622-1371(+)
MVSKSRLNRDYETEEGPRVRVMKHRRNSCAVVTLSSCAVCESVLQLSKRQPLSIRGIQLDVRPHESDSEPWCLFVGWTLPERQKYRNQLPGPEAHLAPGAKDLLKLFEAVAIDFEDVVILVVRKRSQTPEVTSILLDSPILEELQSRMTAVGRRVDEDWADGAKIYVPLEQKHLIDAGVELKKDHILAYSKDFGLIKAALRKLPSGERGPNVKQLRPLQLMDPANSDFLPPAAACWADMTDDEFDMGQP